jgi:HSP20 family protein
MASRNDLDLWMWVEACELLGRAERLQRQFFRPAPGAVAWEPPVDVYEDERELVVVVAMPGVPASRLSVTHEGGAIVVRGARPLPVGAGHGVRQLEIPYGAFERRIDLPPGRFEAGPPELVDGCLVLRLLKV